MSFSHFIIIIVLWIIHYILLFFILIIYYFITYLTLHINGLFLSCRTSKVTK